MVSVVNLTEQPNTSPAVLPIRQTLYNTPFANEIEYKYNIL